MAQSKVQSTAFQALQKRLKGKHIGKQEKRGGKDVYTFNQRGLNEKEKKDLIRELQSYMHMPTLRQEKKERREKAKELVKAYNNSQKMLGSEKRLKQATQKDIDRLWRVYNRVDKNFMQDMGYSSDEVIDFIKINATENQRTLVNMIDNELGTVKLNAPQRSDKVQRAQEIAEEKKDTGLTGVDYSKVKKRKSRFGTKF